MCKNLYIFTVICCFSFALAFGGEDGNEEGTSITMKEIVITATRSEIEILDAPAHVTVVTAEEIKRMGAGNIAKVLSVQAGLTIRDYGPEGSLKSMSIRGSRSEGVLVLVDGIRINDSRAGSVDLSLIPLHSIERIEIVRGGTSALYGADAVGGVVNIITKKEADGRFTFVFENNSYIPRDAVEVFEGGATEPVDANYGDLFDTQKVTLGYSHIIGGVDCITSGSFTRANNGYTWYDAEYIDGYRRRINAEALGGNIYTSVSFPAWNGRFEATGQAGFSNKGAPGPVDPASWGLSTDANQSDLLARGSFRYTTKRFFSDSLTLDMKGSYSYASLAFENPDPVWPEDDTHHTHALNLDAAQEMLSFDAFSLLYGLNFIYNIIDSTTIGNKDRVNGGVFVESPIYLSSRLTLTPVLRYDYYSDFPDSLNFKLSGVQALSSSTSLKSSIAKSYRAPTLNDLFWPNAFGMSGNPDLVPETGYSFEIGVTTIKPSYSIDFFVYTRYMIDEIIWGPEGALYRPNNIGESVYPGIELAARFKLARNLWIDSNAGFIYSYVFKDPLGKYSLGDDRRAPYVPVLSIDGGIEYAGGKNFVSLSTVYSSSQYVYNYFSGDTTIVDGYVVLNASYKRALWEGFSLSLAADNLLNTRYETAAEYVMPPLFIRTGIRAEF